MQNSVPDRDPSWRPACWLPPGYTNLRFVLHNRFGPPPWRLTVRAVDSRGRKATRLGPAHGRWTFATMEECRAWVARVRRERNAEQLQLPLTHLYPRSDSE